MYSQSQSQYPNSPPSDLPPTTMQQQPSSSPNTMQTSFHHLQELQEKQRQIQLQLQHMQQQQEQLQRQQIQQLTQRNFSQQPQPQSTNGFYASSPIDPLHHNLSSPAGTDMASGPLSMDTFVGNGGANFPHRSASPGLDFLGGMDTNALIGPLSPSGNSLNGVGLGAGDESILGSMGVGMDMRVGSPLVEGETPPLPLSSSTTNAPAATVNWSPNSGATNTDQFMHHGTRHQHHHQQQQQPDRFSADLLLQQQIQNRQEQDRIRFQLAQLQAQQAQFNQHHQQHQIMPQTQTNQHLHGQLPAMHNARSGGIPSAAAPVSIGKGTSTGRSSQVPSVDGISPVASKRKRAPSALAVASLETEQALRQQESQGITPTQASSVPVGRRKSQVKQEDQGTFSAHDLDSDRGGRGVNESDGSAGDDSDGDGEGGGIDSATDLHGVRTGSEIDQAGGGNSTPTHIPRPLAHRRSTKPRGPEEELNLKKVRLLRKAELARLSRKQKKDRLEELEGENNVLRQRIKELEDIAGVNSGTTSKSAQHKDKRMKSERSPIGGSSEQQQLQQQDTLMKHENTFQGAGGPISSFHDSSALANIPPAVSISPLQQAESLTTELNSVALGLIQVLNRTDMLRGGALNIPGQQQMLLGSGTTNDLELSTQINRMLELHNSRCLLSAEMSHAFESMLYVDVRSGSDSGGGGSSISPSNSGLGTGSMAPTPGLLPLHFFQWLFSQPTQFYREPSGLWSSLWQQECGATREQVLAILDIKTQGSTNFDMIGLGMGGGFGAGGGGFGMSSSGGDFIGGGEFGPPSSSSSFPPPDSMDQSASGLALSTSIGGGGGGMIRGSGGSSSTGFNRVHSSLLTSFEHFRSLLISHQQSEISILTQLMRILTPTQFAKFVKFAITFGPAVMSSFGRG